ncbi:MAG: 50S ribosomal protein L23 [Alphaproteobacteria bacterium]|jgi:large subunit ribosomal protein L23|nr:50S ribosomal protein L23 [Alphaproteobacteria bacterium]MCS5598092.1 50S ribosomal protein L23 [Alphaproteobacteria bacterium]|tara:strand:- start:3535 stop:3849 length:315 start_codon:yes stop_codon:yes gene_type:complete
MAKKAQAQVTERNYNVILAPHITEKATMALENNAVVFKVTIDATKPEIKAAVENLWGVKVKAVNTVVTKGKTKRFKGIMGKRSDFKKAYVTLEDGQSIDVSAGV